MENKTRVHIIISGRVQGVAFRFFAEKRAVALAVAGWVRNLSNGSVEIMAEGDRANLELFVDELRKGPRLALVEDVDVIWEDYTGEFQNFSVRLFDG